MRLARRKLGLDEKRVIFHRASSQVTTVRGMSTRRVVDMSDKSLSESGLLRLRVDRQPDYGNVVQVPCTGCGKVAVLNPININREFWGAELVCPVCHGPTPVREADPDRPTP